MWQVIAGESGRGANGHGAICHGASEDIGMVAAWQKGIAMVDWLIIIDIVDSCIVICSSGIIIINTCIGMVCCWVLSRAGILGACG